MPNLHNHIEPVIEVVREGAIWSWEGSNCELGCQLLGNGLKEKKDSGRKRKICEVEILGIA